MDYQNPKNVQIPYELFLDLLKYHCLDMATVELGENISKELQKKLDKIVNQNLYGQSKTAATPEEREKARQAYLDRRGIHKDFRW